MIFFSIVTDFIIYHLFSRCKYKHYIPIILLLCEVLDIFSNYATSSDTTISCFEEILPRKMSIVFTEEKVHHLSNKKPTGEENNFFLPCWLSMI